MSFSHWELAKKKRKNGNNAGADISSTCKPVYNFPCTRGITLWTISESRTSKFGLGASYVHSILLPPVIMSIREIAIYWTWKIPSKERQNLAKSSSSKKINVLQLYKAQVNSYFSPLLLVYHMFFLLNAWTLSVT